MTEMRTLGNRWSEQQFPHPAGRLPLIGDVRPSMLRDGLVQTMLERVDELRPIFEAKVGPRRLVFVIGADVAAELCDETRFQKAPTPVINALRELGGDGLFTAYNDEPNWQLAHDLLMPAFTKSAMQTYHATMLAAIDELFDYWDSSATGAGAPLRRGDISGDMTKLTMETISRTAFSHDFGSFKNAEPHRFVPAMVAALRTSMAKGTLPPGLPKRLLGSVLDFRNREHLAYVESMLDDLIAQRRNSGDTSTHDLLGIMLNATHSESGAHLDDLNIRRQILTFMIAGHETTSGALSFALYFLSRNPEVLARAQAEADEILGADRDAEPAYEQVAKFRYIRRVLDEGLRLWPTVPGFARMPRADTVIAGKYRMTTDDFALIGLGGVHRDPAVWPDPLRFDPDRFLPENVKARPAHSYKPFGAGLRACIGRQFALHEAVLVLARILHRYNMSGDPGYQLKIDERLTLMPRGFRLDLTPRAPAATSHTGTNHAAATR
ncbi:cytochrome P450 [Jongsikchunia kroppenstedtii]|uniref:cytochrome P450 n=1 Tax=Jongsikchunia kroppenstedtii TaxID=1121721 RepID=UPI00036CFFC3|nr:cytochrome P450 [Jongsikchunia kroppenstedtii]